MADLTRDRLFVGGQWVERRGDGRLEVINPATEEVIGHAPAATIDEVDRAVEAARTAFDEGPWPRMSPAERSRALGRFHEMLEKRAGEFKDLTVLEGGAPQLLADIVVVQTALQHLSFWVERAASFPFSEPLPVEETSGSLAQGVLLKEPLGVVAGITPFNFPTFVNVWKVGPALAMGNTVVLKPSPYTPLAAYLLAEVAEQADLPPGVVNVVSGGPEVGERLTTHPGVDCVSFTGSDSVGRAIMAQAAPTLKRLVLELGGKSPNIVFADGDLDAACFWGMFNVTAHAGQGCALNTRILVEDSIHDEVVDRLVSALATVKVGDPADPSVMMGPLIRERQRERVERYVATGREEGAQVAFGGGRPAGLDRGFFVEPTLFVGVDNKMTIAQDEIFGPVGAVIRFTDEDDAVRIANDSRYGLAGTVFSSPDRAFRVARRLRTGTVRLNGGGAFGAHAPFGGYKQSGIGRELGDAGLHEYVELKSVLWSVK